MPPTTPLRPALVIAGVTLAVTGATAIPSAADAGAPGADRDRLGAAAPARQAFTPRRPPPPAPATPSCPVR